MHLIVLLKLRRKKKIHCQLEGTFSILQLPYVNPSQECWYCYLKCIEFPWKMIHCYHLKLINNHDEPGWHLEYLHAYLALPRMRAHNLPCAAAMTAHLEKGWLWIKARQQMSYFCSRNQLLFFFLHVRLCLWVLMQSLITQRVERKKCVGFHVFAEIGEFPLICTSANTHLHHIWYSSNPHERHYWIALWEM